MRLRFDVPFSSINVILTLGIILTFIFASLSQTVPSDYVFLPHRWDGTHGVVFFGKGLTRKDARPIRGYLDGVQRGAPIDIFKDFPQFRQAVVDDFAAGSDGITHIAVVLISGRNLRHVILTYDSSGKLVSALDTEPYYAQAIATDESGNIFTLGNKLNETKTDRKPYPLLVIYDAAGHIAGEGLYSNVFKEGSRAVNQSVDNVDPSLMVRDGKVFIFAPMENEILVCLKDGTIVRRMGLGLVLEKIRQSERMKRVSMENVAFVDENRVVLDVIGHSASDKGYIRDQGALHPAAYMLNLNTGQPSLIFRGQLADWNFLGLKGNQLLMLSRVGGQHSAIAHDVPAE